MKGSRVCPITKPTAKLFPQIEGARLVGSIRIKEIKKKGEFRYITCKPELELKANKTVT